MFVVLILLGAVGAAYLFGGTILAAVMVCALRGRLPPSVSIRLGAVDVSPRLLAWVRGNVRSPMCVSVHALEITIVRSSPSEGRVAARAAHRRPYNHTRHFAPSIKNGAYRHIRFGSF